MWEYFKTKVRTWHYNRQQREMLRREPFACFLSCRAEFVKMEVVSSISCTKVKIRSLLITLFVCFLRIHNPLNSGRRPIYDH
jgi:hypothetical protein